MTFTTSIEAINPHTGELCLYHGIMVEADSWELAQYWCDNHAPYCKVDGEFTGDKIHILKHELN